MKPAVIDLLQSSQMRLYRCLFYIVSILGVHGVHGALPNSPGVCDAISSIMSFHWLPCVLPYNNTVVLRGRCSHRDLCCWPLKRREMWRSEGAGCVYKCLCSHSCRLYSSLRRQPGRVTSSSKHKTQLSQTKRKARWVIISFLQCLSWPLSPPSLSVCLQFWEQQRCKYGCSGFEKRHFD